MLGQIDSFCVLIFSVSGQIFLFVRQNLKTSHFGINYEAKVFSGGGGGGGGGGGRGRGRGRGSSGGPAYNIRFYYVTHGITHKNVFMDLCDRPQKVFAILWV